MVRLLCAALLLSMGSGLGGAVAQEPRRTGAADAPKTAVKLETVATGLAHPWGLQFLPDGGFLVSERPGQLRIVDRSGKLSSPIPGVPKVSAKGQGGLLDIALAPGFAESGEIFLSYSEPREDEKNGTSVARAKLVREEGGGGRLEDVRVIFRQIPSYRSDLHFGSRIAFAADGTLFVTTGERFVAKNEAQNPANHIGKIIHITPHGEPAAGNPNLSGWDPKVWSIGHRNSQGAAIDPATGRLWTVEHGAQGGDELNHPEAGKNYGWPVITYGIDYSGAKIGVGTAKAGLEQPVYYWDPSIAVSGLTIYSGDLFPGWKGNFLVGSLKFGNMQRLVLRDGMVVAREVIDPGFRDRVRDVRQGPDGAVYVLTDSPTGRLLRLTPGS
ncbi:MAG: PQQ-dependent sugar dehydrogenase [Hyphomicrobium sp.]